MENKPKQLLNADSVKRTSVLRSSTPDRSFKNGKMRVRSKSIVVEVKKRRFDHFGNEISKEKRQKISFELEDQIIEVDCFKEFNVSTQKQKNCQIF